jgi:hypothetical protein
MWNKYVPAFLSLILPRKYHLQGDCNLSLNVLLKVGRWTVYHVRVSS